MVPKNFFETISSKTPGYAVSVVKDGKTVLMETAGLADLDKGIPITAKTAFRLASLSKQFTAMAVMILVQRQKLNLEDKLTDFFSNYPNYGSQVTVRQLLCHTAGIPDHEKPLYQLIKQRKNIRGYDRSSRYFIGYDRTVKYLEATIYDALEILENQPTPLFSPGRKYLYSDAGYVLLALIIEKISGVSYREFLRQNIFSPLKMVNSDVLDQTKPKIKNRALGYRRMRLPRPAKGGARNDNVTFMKLDYDPLNYIVGDEGVYSSITDMVKWNQTWDEEILVSRESLAEAMAPAKLASGNFGKAGFSWLLGKFNGDEIIYQDGVWVGFKDIILRIPKRKIAVVMLSNRTDLDTQRQRISIAYFAAQKFF